TRPSRPPHGRGDRGPHSQTSSSDRMRWTVAPVATRDRPTRAAPSTGESVEPRDQVGSRTPPSQRPFTEILSNDDGAGEPGCLCDGCVAAWMTAFVIGCDLNDLIEAVRAAMDETETS